MIIGGSRAWSIVACLGLVVALLAGDAGLAGSASAQSSPASAPVTIRIGVVSPTGVTLPVWVAIVLGYDKAENLHFVVERIATTNTIPALLSGQIETMPSSAEVAIAKGAKLKMVSGGFQPGTFFKLYATKKSGIKSFADLKGKRVSVNKYGDPQYMMILQGLSQVGLTAQDVTFVYQSPPERSQSLLSGAIESGIMFPPYEFYLVDKDAVTLVSDLSFAPPYQGNAYSMRDDYIKQHPDVVARFARVIAKSVAAFYDENNWPAFEREFPGLMKLGKFDMLRYLRAVKTDRILNEYPTRKLLEGNLMYLEHFPDYQAIGKKLTIDDLIYVTPEFRDKFEGKVPSIGNTR